jgi:hypothetical protein
MKFQSAELIKDDDGIVKIVLDHDKGRTVLGLAPIPGDMGFFPMDQESKQALIDFYQDGAS